MNRLTWTLATAFGLVFCAIPSSGQVAQPASVAPYPPYAVTPTPAVSSGAAYKTRQVPSVQNIAPFQVEAQSPSPGSLIDFRAEDLMTQQDRELAERAQESMHANASLAGIEFGEGKWTYQQLTCQALPGHLFLLYRGDRGAGDVTLFSAAISRTGNGQVRIIPIQRRGFSPFSPAPVNALTIAAFNRIRSTEAASQNADWLATALCYAALTGAHPETSPIQEKPADPGLVLSFPPTLEVGNDGESTVRFVDVASPHRPMGWALTFNGKGQLLRVTNSALPAYPVKLVPELPAQQSSLAGAASAASTEGSR